ncbi:hypothetical protein [Prauserella flavalba]|uniref:hypothetical protein n=1 Tax=Prauserella flavalba TaxID=1477506 RepID=UPI001FE28D54|nr:hypothetical protein [Prauserella flavalba]
MLHDHARSPLRVLDLSRLRLPGARFAYLSPARPRALPRACRTRRSTRRPRCRSRVLPGRRHALAHRRRRGSRVDPAGPQGRLSEPAVTVSRARLLRSVNGPGLLVPQRAVGEVGQVVVELQ